MTSTEIVAVILLRMDYIRYIHGKIAKGSGKTKNKARAKWLRVGKQWSDYHRMYREQDVVAIMHLIGDDSAKISPKTVQFIKMPPAKSKTFNVLLEARFNLKYRLLEV